MSEETPGRRLRAALKSERPLQVAGSVNAYCALLAERAGFRALYLSGAGVANASYGLPDLGFTTRENVLEDTGRITAVTTLPLLVDGDTGWGGDAMIRRTVEELISAGAAGVQLEDQVEAKRCGHRPGKELVSAEVMCDRLRVAVDGRTDPEFVIMARTDAFATEGLEATLDRCRQYVAAGAEMIFPEALTELNQYAIFTAGVGVPVLANLTEFGHTPLFSLEELGRAGVELVLYPLSAFRAMSAAAERVYHVIRTEGTQRAILDLMQTREQLYDVLGYYRHERKIDREFEKSKQQRTRTPSSPEL